MFDRALSQQEIQSIVQAGRRGKCKGISAAVAARPRRIHEGETATYRISLSETATSEARVKFSMSGDAALDTDYTLSGAELSGNQGRVTIPAGAISADVTLTAMSDSLSKDVTATMTVKKGAGYLVAYPNRATVSIVNP